MIILLIVIAPLLLVALFMLWPYVLFLGVAFVVGSMVSLFLDGYHITPYWGPISVLAAFIVYCVLAGVRDTMPEKSDRPRYDYDADKYPE
jgi:membrane protein implicated in regulation of membrane protease activity